jgi:hypothetical protein
MQEVHTFGNRALDKKHSQVAMPFGPTPLVGQGWPRTVVEAVSAAVNTQAWTASKARPRNTGRHSCAPAAQSSGVERQMLTTTTRVERRGERRHQHRRARQRATARWQDSTNRQRRWESAQSPSERQPLLRRCHPVRLHGAQVGGSRLYLPQTSRGNQHSRSLQEEPAEEVVLPSRSTMEGFEQRLHRRRAPLQRKQQQQQQHLSASSTR